MIDALLRWGGEQKERRLALATKLEWESYDSHGLDTTHLTEHQALERLAYERCGFIFAMYHADTWFAEIVDLARKLVLTGIMVFVERDSSIQVAIGCLINFVMLMASLKIQPIYDPLVDAANNIALLELYLTLFLGLLFRVSAVSDDAGESSLFTVVVAAVVAFIFVYPAVGMVLFSRRSRTTVTPRKSALAKAVSGFLKRTPKTDAAPAEPKADVPKEEANREIKTANPTFESNVAL
jgi:hypothetical protein